MDKFSELKAAAMAATPGPWILDDDSWSEGDNANVSTEERYDGRIVSIAQIEGGGSESGFDEPFSSEQQANARYIAAANPAAALELLAERDSNQQNYQNAMEELRIERAQRQAADKRIAELEAIRSAAEKLVRCKGRYHSEQNYRALAALFGVTTPDLPPVEGDSEAVIAELRAKLATPVRLPALLHPESDAVNGMIFANGRNEAIAECSVAIRQAGFLSEASPMTVEGGEQ